MIAGEKVRSPGRQKEPSAAAESSQMTSTIGLRLAGLLDTAHLLELEDLIEAPAFSGRDVLRRLAGAGLNRVVLLKALDDQLVVERHVARLDVVRGVDQFELVRPVLDDDSHGPCTTP